MILEIIKGNPIVDPIFSLKFRPLFFKDKLDGIIQNPIPIVIKLLLAFFMLNNSLQFINIFLSIF